MMEECAIPGCSRRATVELWSTGDGPDLSMFVCDEHVDKVHEDEPGGWKDAWS